MTVLRHMVVVGVGLIGGSLALDSKRLGLVRRVSGMDADADNLRRALHIGLVDEACTSLRQAITEQTDLVLIAVPVGAVAQVCAELSTLLPAGCVVSDVGSTKQSVLAAFRQYLPAALPRCVAAHPVAGSEQSGAAAARAGLFRGRRVVLCPHEVQDRAALTAVAALWRAAGAEVSYMAAAEHDAAFAAVSHLPQLLAYAYMRQLAMAPEREAWLGLAGSGFRDFSRLAASVPEVWTDVALANRDYLLALLAGHQRQVAELQRYLRQKDAAGLYDLFQMASRARQQWRPDGEQ